MRVLWVLAGVCSFCSVSASDVLEGERARHPLTALLGIPVAASRDVNAGLEVDLLHANAFMGGVADSEALLLDGETTELSLAWQQSWRTCSAVSARVPFVAHGGGVFDAAIEAWHEAFGLPNGGRENIARDQLLFRHVTQDGVFELSSAVAGLGDVSLALQHNLGCRADNAAIPLRVGVKLPTGDARRWLGSGALDLWADVQSPVIEWRDRVRLAGSIGVLLPGDTRRLPTLVSSVLFGAVGLKVELRPRLVAQASFDWHTAAFDGELLETSEPAGQLTVGFAWAADEGTRLQLQISEDVFIDTATDIAVRFSVRRDFAR